MPSPRYLRFVTATAIAASLMTGVLPARASPNLAAFAFSRLDADGSGDLDRTELAAIGARRMQRLDLDGNGQILPGEFIAARKDVATRVAGAEAMETIDFARFDLNGDGVIVSDELVIAEADRMEALADANHDGLISRDEFLNLAATLAMTE